LHKQNWIFRVFYSSFLLNSASAVLPAQEYTKQHIGAACAFGKYITMEAKDMCTSFYRRWRFYAFCIANRRPFHL